MRPTLTAENSEERKERTEWFTPHRKFKIFGTTPFTDDHVIHLTRVRRPSRWRFAHIMPSDHSSSDEDDSVEQSNGEEEEQPTHTTQPDDDDDDADADSNLTWQDLVRPTCFNKHVSHIDTAISNCRASSMYSAKHASN